MSATPETGSGVKRYRKKPVVVEMIRWDGALATRYLIEGYIQDGVYPKTSVDNDGALYVWVAKSHGLAPLAPGDWAVIEPDGSGVYPCTAADQAATYDPAAVPSDARQLVEEALHLRTNGEYAPGGKENWPDWDRKAEKLLRGES